MPADPERDAQESEIQRLRHALDGAEARALRSAEELRLESERRASIEGQLFEEERLASLGALTAGIAHEIRNPLNFVVNFADLLTALCGELGELLAPDVSRLSAAEDIRTMLDEMVQAADKIALHGAKANSIVGSMLQHARGEQQAFSPTDLNALVEEYANLAYHGTRAQHPGFEVSVGVQSAPGLDPVLVNPQSIGRVLLNLVVNALDAVREASSSAPGGSGDPPDYRAMVEVTLQSHDDVVEIMVADNGPGIDAERLEEVLQPFVTTKPVGEGTGLGLPISRDIVVDEHQGDFTIRSEPGRGTEVVITLPKTPPFPDGPSDRVR